MENNTEKGRLSALLPIGVFLVLFLGFGIISGGFSAMPAIVEDGVVADLTVKGNCPIKQQKHIAHIILHRNAEEKIERHADTA